MMFSGRTKNLAVIGWPIAHSLSPVMQNAALQKAGMDFAYIALPVAPADLPEAVRGLRALGFRGFNVTIPHKTAIIPLLDEVDAAARAIGAVNTVVLEEGRLKGCNTDAAGFIGALEARSFSLAGKRVVLLGAGGAARAVLWGLFQAGAAEIVIGVRNPQKARPLAEEFSRYGTIRLFEWHEESFRHAVRAAELVVNATSLGMAPEIEAAPPIPWEEVQPGTFFYDIIYTPAETSFLRRAAAQGCPVLNGEGMLVGQGAAAFKLWTGKTADFAVMAEALHGALERGRPEKPKPER